jgi:alkanesulfonate monooxygenase SsuD/methylene tetrahydromethanopterin reductase-like flavin-dependent oxidoreductase (luciferase family)
LGIGAAWYDTEHAAYGWTFPPVKERFERLSEAVAICRGMFDNETFSFDGDYYTVAEARVVPRPQRRIPIMIGGSGEKKTLRMVAEFADMRNTAAQPPSWPRSWRSSTSTARQSAAPGRWRRTAMVSLFVSPNEADRDSLRQLVGYDAGSDARDRMIIATADEATHDLAAIVAAGADQVIVNLPLIKSVDAIHAAADVLKAATS